MGAPITDYLLAAMFIAVTAFAGLTANSPDQHAIGASRELQRIVTLARTEAAGNDGAIVYVNGRNVSITLGETGAATPPPPTEIDGTLTLSNSAVGSFTVGAMVIDPDGTVHLSPGLLPGQSVTSAPATCLTAITVLSSTGQNVGRIGCTATQQSS